MSYLQTFIFGLTLGLSIGPIAILILNQSINCGFKNGALCGLGAATADLTYAIITFTFGSVLLSLLNNHMDIIPVVSALILIIFGLWMIYTTFRKKEHKEAGKYSLTCKFPLITTYGLTIANPLTIIVFSGFAGILTAQENSNVLIHALVIFLASLSIQMLIALAGSKLSGFFSKPVTLLYFNVVSALGIIVIGVSQLF